MKSYTKLLRLAAVTVAAFGLTSCDGLWVTADDGYYDGPDVDYPYYGYWGGWDNSGYWPIVGTGYWPSPNYPGPMGPPPPPHHRPVAVGPVNNAGWNGGVSIAPSSRPGGMGLGGVSGFAPGGGSGVSSAGSAGAPVGTPSVIVH